MSDLLGAGALWCGGPACADPVEHLALMLAYAAVRDERYGTREAVGNSTRRCWPAPRRLHIL